MLLQPWCHTNTSCACWTRPWRVSTKPSPLEPTDAVAHYNRALVLQDCSRWREAVISYDQAIAISPQYADAQFNRSLTLLYLGDFARGGPHSIALGEHPATGHRRQAKFSAAALAGRTVHRGQAPADLPRAGPGRHDPVFVVMRRWRPRRERALSSKCQRHSWTCSAISRASPRWLPRVAHCRRLITIVR